MNKTSSTNFHGEGWPTKVDTILSSGDYPTEDNDDDITRSDDSNDASSTNSNVVNVEIIEKEDDSTPQSGPYYYFDERCNELLRCKDKFGHSVYLNYIQTIRHWESGVRKKIHL